MSSANKSSKPVGLASDHAGFAAKQHVIKFLTERVFLIRILVHTLLKVQTMPIMGILWQKPWKTMSVIPELPFAEQETESI